MNTWLNDWRGTPPEQIRFWALILSNYKDEELRALDAWVRELERLEERKRSAGKP